MLGSGKESNRHQTSVNLDLETLEDKQPMQANEVLSEDPNERGGASEKDQRGPRAWEDASSDVDEADVHHDGQDDSSEKEENQTDHEKTKPVTEFGLAETNDKRTAREEAFSLGSVEEGDGLNPYESLISGQTSSDNPREPLEVLHVARHNPLQEDAESSQSEAEKRMSSNEEEDDDKEAKIESDHDESESKSDHESGEHEEYEEGRPIDDQQHPENLVQPSDTDLGAFEREKANEPHDEGTIHQPSAVPVSEVPIQPLVSEGGDKELYSEIPEISPNFKVNPLIKQPKVLNEDGSDEQDEQDDSQRRKTAAITAAPREKSPSRHLSSKLSKVTGAKIIIGDAKSDGEEEETISFVARTITLKNSIVTINKRVFEADGGKLSSLAINLGELEKIQVLLEITKEGLIVTSSKD